MIIHLSNDNEIDDSLREAFGRFPTTVIVIFFCLIVAGFVTHLFIYHLRIICKSQSTYEEKKGVFKKALFNPYKQSFCEEITEILFGRRPYKFFDLTKYEASKLEDSIRKLSFKMMKRDKVI